MLFFLLGEPLVTTDEIDGDVKAETEKDRATNGCFSGICWLRAIITVTTLITSANHVFAVPAVVAAVLLAVDHRDSGRRTISAEDSIISCGGRELFLSIHFLSFLLDMDGLAVRVTVM